MRDSFDCLSTTSIYYTWRWSFLQTASKTKSNPDNFVSSNVAIAKFLPSFCRRIQLWGFKSIIWIISTDFRISYAVMQILQPRYTYSFNPCLKGFASSNFQSSFVLREFAKVLSLVVVRVSTKEKESPTTEYHSVVVVVVGKFYSMVCSVHVYNKAFASVHTSST